MLVLGIIPPYWAGLPFPQISSHYQRYL